MDQGGDVQDFAFFAAIGAPVLSQFGGAAQALNGVALVTGPGVLAADEHLQDFGLSHD